MADKATKLPIKKEKTPMTREEGWQPFDSLRREIDRVFDDFLPTRWRSAFARPTFDLDFDWPARSSFQVAPAMDVLEKAEAYEITAELPGLDEKDVELKIANGMLVIKGEKSEEKDEKNSDYYMSERRYGSFQRAFQLPDAVDPDRIAATFAKGVLKVTLPKSDEARRTEKKIDVKAA